MSSHGVTNQGIIIWKYNHVLRTTKLISKEVRKIIYDVFLSCLKIAASLVTYIAKMTRKDDNNRQGFGRNQSWLI